MRIPVAIKVLQEDAVGSPTNALLDEARVMTSVNNDYCVRIIAVSMTAQMMLLTQLMPLGCLLDYIRANRSSIGSQLMLTWCTQIAKVGWLFVILLSLRFTQRHYCLFTVKLCV